jgi:Nucleotidyltransferase of unknown function (DUF6036)
MTPASGPLLDRQTLETAFNLLGERLRRRGVTADVYVFGGAAMILAYGAERATRDVDALFVPHGVVLEEARAVAREMSLPDAWLNEQATSYLASGEDSGKRTVFEHPGLRVGAASADRLLAMKMMAGRDRDQEDIARLADHLGLTTVAEVLAVCAKVFPDENVPARSILKLEDLFGVGG